MTIMSIAKSRCGSSGRDSRNGLYGMGTKEYGSTEVGVEDDMVVVRKQLLEDLNVIVSHSDASPPAGWR